VISKPSSGSLPPDQALVALGGALALLLPSLGQVHKYAGGSGVVVYLLGGVPLVALALPRVLRSSRGRWSEKGAGGLAGAAFVVLFVAFAVVYPLADRHGPGQGSDRDDAVDQATRRLWRGESPYAEPTYLGNPITPLPGALLLASPFVVLTGESAPQNLVWLLLFFLTTRALVGEAGTALVYVTAVLGTSPVALQEILTGGDLLANNLYVLVTAVCLLRASRVRSRALWSCALGVVLSSRANFLLLLPLTTAYVGRHHGWRTASSSLLLTALTAALVTLPFYALDPAGFTPLYTYSKLGRFATVLPGAGLVVPAAAGLLALFLATRRTSLMGTLGACAAVQALPVVSAVVLSSLARRQLDLSYAGYGLSFLLAGSLAAALHVVDEPARETVPTIASTR